MEIFYVSNLESDMEKYPYEFFCFDNQNLVRMWKLWIGRRSCQSGTNVEVLKEVTFLVTGRLKFILEFEKFCNFQVSLFYTISKRVFYLNVLLECHTLSIYKNYVSDANFYKKEKYDIFTPWFLYVQFSSMGLRSKIDVKGLKNSYGDYVQSINICEKDIMFGLKRKLFQEEVGCFSKIPHYLMNSLDTVNTFCKHQCFKHLARSQYIYDTLQT